MRRSPEVIGDQEEQLATGGEYRNEQFHPTSFMNKTSVLSIIPGDLMPEERRVEFTPAQYVDYGCPAEVEELAKAAEWGAQGGGHHRPWQCAELPHGFGSRWIQRSKGWKPHVEDKVPITITRWTNLNEATMWSFDGKRRLTRLDPGHASRRCTRQCHWRADD